MSLHAQLSPEAQARLNAQRRNSTITSIIISILVIVLIGLILAFILLPAIIKETPVIVSYQGAGGIEEGLEAKKVTTTMSRRPSAPSAAMSRVIAANTVSSLSVPVPDIDVPVLSAEFGSSSDFGDGWGGGGDDGGGGGGGFGNIPAEMRKRCSQEDRMQRLTESGGTPECEEAVMKGLRWLKATQNDDGSWTGSNKTAMTGLALLCYLGHCETPLSEEFGESCLKAITWLVNHGMAQNGRLTTTGDHIQQVYEHAIATYALAEATTFCKQLNITVPNLVEVTQKAGQYIIDHQHNRSGGWDYGFSVDSGRGGDLSVSAWMIQALKACSHTGIDFKRIAPALRKSIDYVAERQGDHGGFGYVGKGDHDTDGYHTLTGAGVLALQMAGRGSHAAARSGARYIEEKSKFDFNTPFADLYGHYYESQAMMNRGGAQWTKYNNMFRDQLLKNQNEDGSWKAPGGGQKLRAVAADRLTSNTHYRTTLCILMLEVYYRFLPGTGEGTK